jgi:hypothetical protein
MFLVRNKNLNLPGRCTTAAEEGSYISKYETRPMRSTNMLLTAALSLTTSALTVPTAHAQGAQTPSTKSADIKISSLPFNISVPGTYVLTGDLTYTPGVSPSAITIFTAGLGGPVVVDLKGFTITGPVSFGYGVLIGENKIFRAYPITIRNGTIKNFQYGVFAANQGDVTINKLSFFLSPSLSTSVAGVNFGGVDSSRINNCTFNVTGPISGPNYGIWDRGSGGGNSYNNNTFLNVEFPLLVVGQNPLLVEGQNQSTLTLDHCTFAAGPPY